MPLVLWRCALVVRSGVVLCPGDCCALVVVLRLGGCCSPVVVLRTPAPHGYPFRTTGGRFRYRISLPYRKSLFFTQNASENTSRTGGALLRYRASILYRRSPFPVPNFQTDTRCPVWQLLQGGHVERSGEYFEPPKECFELHKKKRPPL